VIRSLRQRTGGTATTVMTVVSTAEINQHTVTYLGRRNGGRIVGGQLAVRSREFAKVRPRVEWLVLAPGRGDLSRRERALHRTVRRDPTFRLAQAWDWSGGRLELWQRARSAPPPQRFDEDFIRLARSMERGVGGVAAVFDSIGLEHSLDGHFLYQERIRSWAEQRLRLHPDDRNALWSLALLQVLRNRPLLAEPIYARLQRLAHQNPWPSLYRSIVLLAAWRPWSAVTVLAGTHRAPQMEAREAAILRDALLVLSRTLGGDLRQLPQLKQAYSRGEQAIRNTLPEDNR
jgi:hypothetical protein